MPENIEAALSEFAATLTANFAVADVAPAQAEDQLKGPMQTLLKVTGQSLNLDVVARTEARTDLGVRPDLGVAVNGLPAGHVELKAPGKGARVRAFADPHDKEQAKKLEDHPNLLYTDGIEWALYRHGQAVGNLVQAEGDVRTDGEDAYGTASAQSLQTLFSDFLGWEPLVPSTPKALAELLAPLTRLLRENVRTALSDSSSALATLAEDWRKYFFPEADDEQFADAYAQTLTYALLLARVEGEDDLHDHAADRLQQRHALLAQVLRVVTDRQARREVEVAVDLLERTIQAVDPAELAKRAKDHDIWLYFYEDFLAAYDSRLRKQRGVYFTPKPVVQAQVALVSELLRTRFGKPLGFASDDVTVLDPAVGTGTYLLSAIDEGADRVRAVYGDGSVPARATIMASTFHGFELLIGSYAVAHLRVARRIAELGGQLPADGLHVYLTDTLESPNEAPPELANAPLFARPLADENKRARHVKKDVSVLVCIGNPPYFRQVIEPDEQGVERQGGWVRHGDAGADTILHDFLRDTPGIHVKNVYNLYVYFWRWALWKVFENSPGRGIVSFITAASYLRGPGFAGMRRFMRETFDDLWILDLGGELRGARQSENVFDIQTPVAIALGVRYDEAKMDTPAQVRYARVDGTRAAKEAQLEAIASLENVEWQDCFSGWTQPFLPEGAGGYFAWPLLTDLFPWQHSGAQFKPTWPIAPDRETLTDRWRRLVSASAAERKSLFRETRDRKVAGVYPPLVGGSNPSSALAELDEEAPAPKPVPYAYRTLDRQYCLADNRLGDFMRPVFWRSLSAQQLFMTSALAGELGSGPAASVTNLVPDLHHFSGRGGKDAIPLWRDAKATSPNVASGLLADLSSTYGTDVTAEDFFAYVYATLSAPEYTVRFSAELEVPGPRAPITRDGTIFGETVALGKRLIWLHTYGERFVPDDGNVGEIPTGKASNTRPIGGSPDDYPERHSYDPATKRLLVGGGVFEPVEPKVRAYSVSGLDVIGSWLDYRMREGAGRRSSPLDRIRPRVWPAGFNEGLLHLLWVIEHTVALGPALNDTLEKIVSGPLVVAADLPAPRDEQRRPPGE